LATDGDPDSPDAYMKQCVANGVRANEFLEAVASCDEPPIRAALSRAFDRAGDLHVILATAPAAGEVDAAKVRRKLVERIEALEENDAGPYGDGFNLLVALGKSGGDESKEVFKDYLTTLTVARRRTMCHVLRQVRREWAAELLAEFLTDRREIGRWTYAVDPDDSERRLPLRICDEAAVTIAAVNEQLEFNIQGSHADMNERIDVLKARVKELKH
jgi:hypothetical protein